MTTLSLTQKSLAFFLFISFAAPNLVFGAFFDLKMDGVQSDGNIKIDVYASTDQKNPFNAASALISFNQSIFSIEEIDLKDSIFNFWTEEPNIKNVGHLSFGGGTTGKGGFVFDGKIFSFLAKPVDFGESTFDFLNEKILKSDGYGSNIFEYSNNLPLRHEEVIPSRYDTNKDGLVSIKELSVGLSDDA